MTGADAYVADQLFATLDPTVRRVQLPGGTPIVLADTVGFIRELPHELVAAFQSTLTEAREATLLLHVVDASDPRRDEHIEEVNRVLEEIGAGAIPQIRVYNKIDRLETGVRVERDDEGRITQVWVSAARDLGLEECARQSPRGWRGSPVRRGCGCRPLQGALRARLFAAGAVRERGGDRGRAAGDRRHAAGYRAAGAGAYARCRDSQRRFRVGNLCAPGGYLQFDPPARAV
jgi:GTPase